MVYQKIWPFSVKYKECKIEESWYPKKKKQVDALHQWLLTIIKLSLERELRANKYRQLLPIPGLHV
jgi:hypothetical protein